MDLVVKAERIPRPGETVLGGDFSMVSGGKGANQAVAAARLGGNALFVARVGPDLFGSELIRYYSGERMDTTHIVKDLTAPTGVALISVDAGAENTIVVAPGANARLGREDIDRVKPEIAQADYLLLQLEIPIDTVEYAIKTAAGLGVRVILNPAPAAMLDASCFGRIHLITPNETECALLTGIEIGNEEDARAAADAIRAKGVENVIITCGSRGSFVRTAGGFDIVPALRVEAVDTTAAGDVFNGALAVALAEGNSLPDAVRFATCAAAISVTRMGAQSSVPQREEVDLLLRAQMLGKVF